MPRQTKVSPRARVDLDDIWEFIATDSVSAADRVMEEFQECVRNLRDMPGQGHRRMDLSDQTVRFWSFYSYLIAYRYDDDALTIVRVIHGQRDIGPLLER